MGFAPIVMGPVTVGCSPAHSPSPVQADLPRSPAVAADGRVTFRLRAPGAHAVSLKLESEPPAPLVDNGGVWTLTTAPLVPDYYGYAFDVDGVQLLDPSNPSTIPNLIAPRSVVHVRGAAAQPWEEADVPHGVIHRHFFHSSVVGDDRDFYVYTPPGYDEAKGRSYPVLYLLHGFSDDASAWTAVGRAHVVLDNLIAQRRVEPMIVVMPLGYGAPEILDGGFSGFARDRQLLERNLDRFRDSLLGEVMPRVETTYRISAARATRAIAGLSMGGAEALRTGLNRLDLFAWIGAFSTGGLSPDLAHDFEGLGRAGESPSLVFISCGTADALLSLHHTIDGWLTSRNVAHTAREVPGGHVWGVWRRDLVEFVPLLFRARPGVAP